MSDRNMRSLVRRFEAGDVEAGAKLAVQMLRAQSLFYAVGALAPVLQEALAGRTVVESLRDEITAALAEGISVADVASEIDPGDVASMIADNMDASDVAEHVDVDYDELAESVASRVVDHLDMDELATLVAAKLAETVEEAVEAALAERE